MKIVGIVILSFIFTLKGIAQNPKEIIDKCVDALGGAEAIEKYADYQANGDMKFSMRGMEITGKIKLIQKDRKSWTRSEIVFGKDIFVMIQAYDGETAFSERQGTVVDQPALNYESDLDHTVSLLIEKDAAFSLAKATEIEGKRVIGIEANFNGKKTIFFIDSESYALLEIVYKDLYFGEKYTKEMLEKRIRYADYKKLDKVLFPTRMTFYEKGEKRAEFHLSEVSFNPQVAADKFKRPDQELDLRYWEERID